MSHRANIIGADAESRSFQCRRQHIGLDWLTPKPKPQYTIQTDLQNRSHGRCH